MEQTIMVRNIDTIIRQRNIFFVFLIILMISCFLLIVKLTLTKEKIILVPGLNQEVWTDERGVSSSYLEETSAMFLPLLLDLNADSIDWKRDHLLKYVSHSDKSYMRALIKYFAISKENYTKFGLSTHFAVKSFEVNEKDLTVRATGLLISRFGKRGYTSEPITYGMGYEWVGGKLLLTEFVKLNLDKNGKLIKEEANVNPDMSNIDEQEEGEYGR